MNFLECKSNLELYRVAWITVKKNWGKSIKNFEIRDDVIIGELVGEEGSEG